MKKFLAFFMPIFGAIYLSAYIRSAMLDVVYTDYIRIINTYLKDRFHRNLILARMYLQDYLLHILKE